MQYQRHLEHLIIIIIVDLITAAWRNAWLES